MSSEKDLENQSRKKSFDENGIPDCLRWSVLDVERWVEEDLKFPQYRVCKKLTIYVIILNLFDFVDDLWVYRADLLLWKTRK